MKNFISASFAVKKVDPEERKKWMYKFSDYEENQLHIDATDFVRPLYKKWYGSSIIAFQVSFLCADAIRNLINHFLKKNPDVIFDCEFSELFKQLDEYSIYLQCCAIRQHDPLSKEDLEASLAKKEEECYSNDDDEDKDDETEDKNKEKEREDDDEYVGIVSLVQPDYETKEQSASKSDKVKAAQDNTILGTAVSEAAKELTTIINTPVVQEEEKTEVVVSPIVVDDDFTALVNAKFWPVYINQYFDRSSLQRIKNPQRREKIARRIAKSFDDNHRAGLNEYVGLIADYPFNFMVTDVNEESVTITSTPRYINGYLQVVNIVYKNGAQANVNTVIV